ncbi:MAG: alpha/beta fold hydrolase [Anaerolineae bacterium]|nr:alpha/beta fold hydrolase [Anaerolineae bacterium]
MSFLRSIVITALLLAAFLATFSVSAAQDLNLKMYTTRDGLAGDFVTAIAFEPNGSVWVGTTEGATHISDAGWVSYTAAHGLGDSWITALTVAPDGRIWFATQSGGIAVLDPTTRVLTPYNLENSDIPSNFVTALAVDSSNQLWVGTLGNGIARFDTAQNTWTTFERFANEVTAITLDQDELPWVGTDDGAYHFDGTAWTRDENVGEARVRRIDAFDGKWYLATDDARYTLKDGAWAANDSAERIDAGLSAANLGDAQITAFGKDYQERIWLGTPRGVLMAHHGNAPTPPTPYPVVLVHGWTVAGDDTLESSEFRFLKSFADRDGIPMFYAEGVKPENTLYQNAAVIRDEIARVKGATGADKVNLVGFSMGGMNSRAYLETSLYGNDVNRVIILGTPQAGVEVWKPILVQQILAKPDQPSAIELSPEYAQQVVNETRAPNRAVPYDLLIGDAREQTGMAFLEDMPASDALISVASALALDAPNVRHHVNADLHDWGPEPVPLDLTGYLYPRATWERYLRNALFNRDNAPIGWEVRNVPDGDRNAAASVPYEDSGKGPNHTPVVTREIRAGETITNSVVIDENSSARFIAYYPGGEIDFSLVAPGGETYEPDDLPREDDSGVLSLSTDIASFSGYVIQDAPPGEWQLVLARTDSGAQPIQASTYVELDSPQRLVLREIPDVNLGGAIQIQAQLTQPVQGTTMRARMAEPAQKSGEPFELFDIELFDDGLHDDGAANDGVFAGAYSPLRAGWHTLTVEATGAGVERASEALFAVNPSDVTIDRNMSRVSATDSSQFQVVVNSGRAGSFALGAALQDATSGSVIARTFVPVALDVGKNQVPIAFDTSKLAPTPFALNVVLLDTNWAAFELDRATLAPTDANSNE